MEGLSIAHRLELGKPGLHQRESEARRRPLSFRLRDHEQNDTDTLVTDMVDCIEGLWGIVFSAVLNLTGFQRCGPYR